MVFRNPVYIATENVRRIPSIVAVAAVSLLLASNSVSAEARIALVIGNGDYPNARLSNPARDAHLMARTLRGLGFEVVIKTHIDRNEMRQAIRAFGKRVGETPGAVAFFYYSGHGLQVNGRNYMIPINAKIQSETDAEDDGVAARSVLRRMELAKSKVAIVVFDACRNNPYEKRFKSANQSSGLSRMTASAGMLVAYATSPHRVARNGPPNSNSPYTKALAAELRTSSANLLTLFNSVATKVFEATNGHQRPYVESSVIPAFAFRPSSRTPTVPRQRETLRKARAAFDNGNNYLEKGQYELAIKAFSKSIALTPERPSAYYQRAMSYGAIGQHERAIADFTAAIAIQPNNSPSAYLFRAGSREILGRRAQAIQDYKKILELFPNSQRPAAAAAESLKRLGAQ